MIIRNKIRKNFFFCISALSLWNCSFAGEAEENEDSNQTELALLMADTTNNESSKENRVASNQESQPFGNILTHEYLIGCRFIQFDFKNTTLNETLLTENNVHKVNLEQVALCDGLVFDISRPHIELVNLYSYLKIFNQSNIAELFNKVLGSLKLNLEAQDLSNYNLSNANLKDANLKGTNLTRANLSHANLKDTNLNGANLIEANLTGANLIKANLNDTKLTEANLNEAKLTEANLNDAKLDYANLNHANL